MAELPTLDGFRVLEELGSGSLSTVYKAVEEPLGRTVALKVLRSTIAPSSPFAAQLEREARVLAKLCHPNIGLLYAFSKSDARTYLVLEYVDGFSLAAFLKKRPTVAPDSVAAIGTAVAAGLAHAHRRGIVHRDIKPANILVSRSGEVKIFDFGIAQGSQVDNVEEPVALSPVRLEDLAPFGTPAYMSPEQILGEGVDARSDLFSLGVVLYQLLCGARPFERGDASDRRPAAHRIRRDPPIPLHRRAPDIPVVLERIVMRAIQKLPADRFQTAEAMGVQLDEFVTAHAGFGAHKLVLVALEQAGLTQPSAERDAAAPAGTERASLRRTIAGLAVLGAVAITGGALLQSTARREGELAGARPLDLLPVHPGYLRVLAIPWAEVWVDGQRVDTTPFARAVPLPEGTHYVTLVHPSAPMQKHVVSIERGQTRTIDVVMAVPELAPREDAGAEAPSAERERKR